MIIKLLMVCIFTHYEYGEYRTSLRLNSEHENSKLTFQTKIILNGHLGLTFFKVWAFPSLFF
jgi:hypothetical protein